MEITCCSTMRAHLSIVRLGIGLMLALRGKLLRAAWIFSVGCSKWLIGLLPSLCVFLSGIFIVRFLVLIYDPSWARRCKHIFLKHFSMDSGLRRRCNSGFPRSMCKGPMLQAKDGFRCTQMSARRLSSANIALWAGPLSPLTRMPLLTLLDAVCTRSWGGG